MICHYMVTEAYDGDNDDDDDDDDRDGDGDDHDDDVQGSSPMCSMQPAIRIHLNVFEGHLPSGVALCPT